MRGRLLAVAAGVGLVVDVLVTFLVAPEAANFRAPLTQRIFYYHVPAAWVAYLAFAVTAFASARHLLRGDLRSDAVALASAEVGAVFGFVALGTGLVWAEQEFLGYTPVEDPQVISLVVLLLAYMAYFVLRGGIEEPVRRRRLAAVYGLLAVLGVPLSYLASKASIHPDFTRPDQELDPRLGLFLLFSTVVFTLVYAALVDVRARLARVEAFVEESEAS